MKMMITIVVLRHILCLPHTCSLTMHAGNTRPGCPAAITHYVYRCLHAMHCGYSVCRTLSSLIGTPPLARSMITRDGHLFHIDYGKFLGNAQKFGAIKRDRVPFVLTSDMAFVINGGEKPTAKFQGFIDTCCRCFNILRRNSHLLLNLMGLMLNSGIPELQTLQDLEYGA